MFSMHVCMYVYVCMYARVWMNVCICVCMYIGVWGMFVCIFLSLPQSLPVSSAAFQIQVSEAEAGEEGAGN